METIARFLPLINSIILLGGVIIGLMQLARAASNSKVSALAQVMSEQRAISELMLKYDDLRLISYPERKKEEARRGIFLTLWINNASLAYEQKKLGLIKGEQGKTLVEHIRKEFRRSQELTGRLKTTKEAYDPQFVSLVLDQ